MLVDDGDPAMRRVDCDLTAGMLPIEEVSPVLGLDLCFIGDVATCLALIADKFCKFVASCDERSKW